MSTWTQATILLFFILCSFSSSMVANSPILDAYYDLLKACKIPFACPKCKTLVLAKYFEKHVKVCYNLNPETECVWCFGDVKWKRRKKFQFVQHLRDCFKHCLFRKPPPLPSAQRFSYNPIQDQLVQPINEKIFTSPPIDQPTQSFILDDMHNLLSPEKDFFGRKKLPGLPKLAYKPFALRKLNLDSLPVTFQNENLNVAAACVQLFFQLQDTHDFYHCMVRVVVLPQFIDAMLADRKYSFMLPFFCFCDGGDQTEERHRHHRHMIIGSLKGHFEKHVWNKIKIRPEDRPLSKKGKLILQFHSRLKKPINTPMHLVNVLGYLSKRKSRCNGHLDEKKQSKVYDFNHFYIDRSLPVHFKESLAALWDGGLLQLIRQTYMNLAPKHMASVARYERGRWRIRIQDIHNIELHRVLAVAKHLKPTPEPTERYLHLLNGQKLFFKRDDALLTFTPEEWGRVQAENGNVFYSAIGNNDWVPRQYQQQCLNAIEDYKRQKNYPEEPLQDDLDHTQRAQFVMQQHTLKMELVERNAENLTLKTELAARNAENHTLKMELDARNDENHTLTMELDARDDQIHQLKTELAAREALK